MFVHCAAGISRVIVSDNPVYKHCVRLFDAEEQVDVHKNIGLRPIEKKDCLSESWIRKTIEKLRKVAAETG